MRILSYRQTRPLADLMDQTLTFKLMPKIDDVLKADVVKWSAFYEHRIRNGSVSDKPSLQALDNTNCRAESCIPSRGLRCKIHEALRRVSRPHSSFDDHD
jgi:hypothetical protein